MVLQYPALLSHSAAYTLDQIASQSSFWTAHSIQFTDHYKTFPLPSEHTYISSLYLLQSRIYTLNCTHQNHTLWQHQGWATERGPHPCISICFPNCTAHVYKSLVLIICMPPVSLCYDFLALFSSSSLIPEVWTVILTTDLWTRLYYKPFVWTDQPS